MVRSGVKVGHLQTFLRKLHLVKVVPYVHVIPKRYRANIISTQWSFLKRSTEQPRARAAVSVPAAMVVEGVGELVSDGEADSAVIEDVWSVGVVEGRLGEVEGGQSLLMALSLMSLPLLSLPLPSL